MAERTIYFASEAVFLGMPLAFPITRSQVAAPGLLDFGAQQIVQRDDAQDFPDVIIHQDDEVARGFD